MLEAFREPEESCCLPPAIVVKRESSQGFFCKLRPFDNFVLKSGATLSPPGMRNLRELAALGPDSSGEPADPSRGNPKEFPCSSLAVSRAGLEQPGTVEGVPAGAGLG
ncbi:hypothetical protein DUI87_24038 [Hirundo rustica rustica]|uniref:Uncharacterized protein n=1 Tax=Hirundo rustica rustica TaxID=333673 RepID=A0A3M0JE51_HIRRU|nr:hypothetical protein DUI87_24038 [Hirundo rustica rustica]